jgi:hypothetical protein
MGILKLLGTIGRESKLLGAKGAVLCSKMVDFSTHCQKANQYL